MFLLAATLTLIITFALGSIPWGVVISKVVYKDDVRNYGSGNIGTTNMIRSFGKAAGYAVFILDFAKGVVSGLISIGLFEVFVGASVSSGIEVSVFGVQLSATDCKNILLAISFAGCIWGHIFSPFLKVHGGKGIAVAVGNEFVSITPIGAIIELAIFGVLVACTKYVSVGSIAASLACLPLSVYFFWGNPVAVAFMWAGALTVFWAHRENMARLRNGSEHKI